MYLKKLHFPVPIKGVQYPSCLHRIKVQKKSVYSVWVKTPLGREDHQKYPYENSLATS